MRDEGEHIKTESSASGGKGGGEMSETGGSRVREGREEGGGMKENGRQGEKERTRAGERDRHTHRKTQTGARVHGYIIW